MKERAAFGSHRALDRKPGQLVSECDYTVRLGEHPGAEALGEVVVRLTREPPQEPRLDT